MSKRFVCPEAEGYDLPGTKRLILTELFEIRDNVNTDKLITQDGLKTLFFEDVIKQNDQRRGVFGFDSMIRYLDFFNIPAELKTIAQIATATGAVIASNFTDTSNWLWRFRSLSELYALPYWFTVFLEDSVMFIQPVRGTTSVYRGTVTANNRINDSRQKKTGILFTGETGAVIKNFPDVSTIIPELLDDARKRMFDNKSKSVADTITFSAGEGFYAEPGDWVRYEDVYIVVSRRENNGLPVYTAVREVTDNPTYATADIPFGSLITALNSAMLGGKVEADLEVADSVLHGGKSSAFLVPVGTILPYGGAAAPTGYLLCTGTSYLRADYADLFAVIGTSFGAADGTHFNVPDLRGQFLRGKDGGAGVDPNAGTRTALKTGGATGDNVGSYEADALQGHKHTTPAYYGNAGATRDKMYGVTEQTLVANVSSSTPVTDGTNGTPRTSSESRPKNVSVNYIIKT